VDPLFAAWADLLQTHMHFNETGNIASKLEWSLSGAAWKRFLAAALEGGADLAHRLSKPTALQLHKIASDGTHHPSSLLQDQVNMWTDYWKCGTTSAHIPDLVDLDAVATNSHDFTSGLLRSASASFKPRTSVVDGISPRQFSLVSDKGLELLSSIFWLCQQFGTFGNTITDLAIRLLLKTDGGRRPIALFRAMFRLYGKARKEALQTWDKSVGLGHFFNMAPTRHVTDSTYRSMLHRLLEPHLHHAELLWDVAKCFEHVKHTRLWNDAQQHGYPVAVLRCSLLAYTWVRRLLWDNGICSQPLRPSRGIGAGSFSATFEFKLYMINTVTQFAAQWPHLSLSLHVDDLSLGHRHASLHTLLHELREAAAWLIYSFQNELGLPFSPTKAVTLASSEAILQAVKGALGQHSGTAETSTRRLGVDYSLLLTTRPTKVLNKRLLKAKYRATRQRKWAGNAKHAKLYTVAPSPPPSSEWSVYLSHQRRSKDSGPKDSGVTAYTPLASLTIQLGWHSLPPKTLPSW
jgi:hypothetical protein